MERRSVRNDIWILNMLITICFLIFPVALALSDPFAPKSLRISAPTVMNYSYDGNALRLPFTLNGTPASVTLVISKLDQPAKRTRNGFLGWHYVDRIDTCIYISTPKNFQTGNYSIEWDGKNQDGVIARANVYRYYLWGYDNTSAGQLVTTILHPNRGDRSIIITHDIEGYPLANPQIIDAPRYSSLSSQETRKIRTKWCIGDDPSDSSVAETCSYFSWTENSPLAFLQGESAQRFFVQTLKPDGNLVLRQYRWMPNGEAIRQPAWGNDGEAIYKTTIPVDNAWYSGPVLDGLGYLFFTDADISGNGKESNIVYVDAESGDVLARRDLSNRWMDSRHSSTGPTNLEFRDGWLFCTSPASCLFQMINPYGEFNDAVLWENGNGDGVGDKNSRTTWDCSDPLAPPFVYESTVASYHFVLFPADGLANTSFGLLAPDGKGIGHYAFAGNSTDVNTIKVLDSWSSYDGIYYNGLTSGGEETGWMYVASCSFRGVIGSYDDWQKYLYFITPAGGEILIPGLKYDITWKSDGLGLLDIEYSTDGGVTWKPIASGAFNHYLWTVPDVNSSNCKIRITGTDPKFDPVISDGLFTISGPTVVSGRSDAAPLPFITASNHPNPFNPSTTIHYTLGMKGIVTITVYNAVGQQVMRRTIGHMDRGAHDFLFDGAGLTSGLYFYRIATENATAAGKMLMVR